MVEKKKVLDKVPQSAEKAESRFSKEQLLVSKRFRDKEDLVNALLEDGKLYTMRSVEERIEKYKKGKVK
ncbi:hypothetical protein [Acetatifactor muris]|uniref:hypothetical protein n=1 Tax=Acetatifactor muris TaxID=879566 RepID=UPI0023F0D148|nr:hypothetical protein [Acetatifactor muris]